MDKLLVDTCVVSYLVKNHSLALHYRPLLEGKLLNLSFMSLAELYRWSMERHWGDKKIQQLEEAIQQYVILPSDNKTCWYWAKVRSVKGHPISEGDAWIAATALCYDLPLVTHNVKHFQHLQELGLVLQSCHITT